MNELGVQSRRSFYRGEVGVKGGANVDIQSWSRRQRRSTVDVE